MISDQKWKKSNKKNTEIDNTNTKTPTEVEIV